MSERYDTFLQVRLTTHDKEWIKARALEAGMQTSEYVRKRALGELAQPRTRPRANFLESGPPVPLDYSLCWIAERRSGWK